MVAKYLCTIPFCRTGWSSYGCDPAAGDLSEYQGNLEGEFVNQALLSMCLFIEH